MEHTPKLHGGGHHDRHNLPQHGTGRVISYYFVLILFNVMLAVYSLYMLGKALEFNWAMLSTGSLQAILESALQLLLLFSPVILTIILNRLLYRVFRGHGRFPRGTWLFASFAVVLVQIATIMLIFGYGYVDGTGGVNIEHIIPSPTPQG